MTVVKKIYASQPMRSFLMLLCVISLGVLARAQDFQSWDEVDLTASWNKVSFDLPMLVRVDSRLPNPQLSATGLTADFSLRWHLTLTCGYLFADLPQRSAVVHVPLIAVSPSFRVRRFPFTDRNRFEKLIGFGMSPVRYRNRASLDRPFDHNEQWHVFVDDEVFFDLSAGTWNQNRFQVGSGAKVGAKSALDVYYLLRNVNAGVPETHAVGLTLKIDLTPGKKGHHENEEYDNWRDTRRDENLHP
jgi:hypothetical protein